MIRAIRRILPVFAPDALLSYAAFHGPGGRAGFPQACGGPTAVGDNLVAYPQLEGLADAGIQQAVNDDIILRGTSPGIWYPQHPPEGAGGRWWTIRPF